MKRKSLTPSEQRKDFLEQVKKTRGCWMWMGRCNKQNYGFYNSELAHRASLRLFTKRYNPDLFVCHHCDNPQCVRPSHLYSGTATDNMRDAAKRGRFKNRRCPNVGVNNVHAKLTEEQVLQIRKKYACGTRSVELAREYGMNRKMINNIVARRNWTHI